MLDNETVMGQLLAVLREGYEGPTTPWSYFTDARPDAGLTGSLKTLSAADASRSVAGLSIVAHVHHVAFGMNASADWIRGDHTPKEWDTSWSILSVDDQGWIKLKQTLQEAYDNLRQAMAFHNADSAYSFGGAVASIAHLAYHLGAIRQKLYLIGT
ncbi:MAG TPA: hypothetical protein PLN21_16180 [Gemmatales bacterium]|nr:hypothetical protein [Gemmatales bacterium]